MELLSLQGAKEAINHRVVEQLPLRLILCLTAHLAMHRSVRLHLVVSASIRVHDQFGSTLGPRKRCLECAVNQLEDRTSCHAVHQLAQAAACSYCLQQAFEMTRVSSEAPDALGELFGGHCVFVEGVSEAGFVVRRPFMCGFARIIRIR